MTKLQIDAAMPEADAQRPAMKPLTDGQIIEIRKQTPTDHSRPWGDTLSFARAIEAAQGIK